MIATMNTLTPRRKPTWLILSVAAVLVYYWFALTKGTWCDLQICKSMQIDYFDSLASSFLRGRTDVDYPVDPKLLLLRNPYSPEERDSAHVDFLWDAVFYKGRYYLWWGPTPALVAAAIKALSPARWVVGDHILTFLFTSLMFLAGAGLITDIYKKRFAELGPLLLNVCVLTFGFGAYATWLLARPEVYEASLSAGQCFAFVALALAWRGSRTRTAWLIGLALAAAACARNSLVCAIIPILVYALLKKVRPGERWLSRKVMGYAAAMALPLVVAAGLYLRYNSSRFGNPFDLGTRYALTISDNRARLAQGTLLSLRYMGTNLGNYLLDDLAIVPDAPYVFIPYGVVKPRARQPFPFGYWYYEPVAGIFKVYPVVFLGALSVLAVGKYRRWAAEHRDVLWLVATMLCFSLLTLLVNSLFFVGTMRHASEFSPGFVLAALLTILSVLHIDHAAGSRRVLRGAFIVLCACTIAIGALLGLSGEDASIDLTMRTFYPGVQKPAAK
ncbi:MAG: hypothetical protein V1873_08170 [Verrucomicrobiota bacterium]